MFHAAAAGQPQVLQAASLGPDEGASQAPVPVQRCTRTFQLAFSTGPWLLKDTAFETLGELACIAYSRFSCTQLAVRTITC